jgi:hypothetical protein
MKYHDVLKIQKDLKETIEATAAAEGEAGSVNSIVKLMALNNPAKIPDLKGGKEGLAIEVMHAEMRELRKMMEITLFERSRQPRRGAISAIEYERLSSTLDKIQASKRMTSLEKMEKIEQLHMLLRETEDMMMRCEDKSDHMHFRYLTERIHRAISDN